MAVSLAQGGCTGPGCDENSPVLLSLPFYELHVNRVPNDQKIQVVGFRSQAGVPLQIDVRGANVVGLDALGRVALDTPSIPGSVLTVVDGTGTTFEIELHDAASMSFWAGPPGLVTTYELRVRVPGGEWVNLCKRPPHPVDWPGIVTHAVLFAGDRYRHTDKTVMAIGPETAGWFNVACAGSATLKMHLTRHNDAGADPLHPTDKPQRQAMLRAYTATVCPGSQSFTGVGEKLHVADSVGLMQESDEVTVLEGLWDENGAICLGTQRLVDANSMSQEEANALHDQIKVQCPLVPDCKTMPDVVERWRDHARVLTVNP
jgi:ADYC domain